MYIDPEGLAYSSWGEHGIGPDGHRDPRRKEEDECIARCLARQWNIFNTATGLGSTPIPKPLMGVPTTRGASPFTNPISAAGHHMTKNRRGGGRIGRQVLGTNRWAGLFGRINMVTFAGINIYDVTKCQVECKQCE